MTKIKLKKDVLLCFGGAFAHCEHSDPLTTLHNLYYASDNNIIDGMFPRPSPLPTFSLFI